MNLIPRVRGEALPEGTSHDLLCALIVARVPEPDDDSNRGSWRQEERTTCRPEIIGSELDDWLRVEEEIQGAKEQAAGES